MLVKVKYCCHWVIHLMDTLCKLETSTQEKLLVSILSSISEGVIVSDATGKFMLMNQAAHRITGITKGDLNQDHWSELFGCYLADGVTRCSTAELPIIKAMRGESTDDVELLLTNQFLKEPVWISMSGRPLEESRTGGGVVIFRDITIRKKADAEIARSNAELQQFAYVAAHDLQEPLRTVVSYLELLTDRYKGKLDEKADKYITGAGTGAKRMQALIGDLLTYSRVATKCKALERVDCTALVNAVIGDLDTSITEARATIDCGPLPVVMADRHQISQLLQNLIGNALKYRGEEPVQIKISAERRGPDWMFSIEDNGIGFEMQYAERIFLIFQRLHVRTQYSGTGIGLAICKRIVGRHGGEIWATSSLGLGSKFFFTIPELNFAAVPGPALTIAASAVPELKVETAGARELKVEAVTI
jgi:signal transduction histidine kinase